MSIIAIANQKGGVGKTTLAAHLAYWLAQQGRKVIIVDADPQGNATSWALNGELPYSALWSLLIAERNLGELIQPARWDGVRILPSSQKTGDAMIVLRTINAPFSKVASSLRPLEREADYVLIDMPPSRNSGFLETLFAAEHLLIPTQLERMAVEGIVTLTETLVALRSQQGAAPQLLGIAPNMARLHTNEHQYHMKLLIDTFNGAVWPAIPNTVKVAEANSFSETVFEYAPENPIASAFERIGQRVISNLESE
jgi:chromosome partitioning protein